MSQNHVIYKVLNPTERKYITKSGKFSDWETVDGNKRLAKALLDFTRWMIDYEEGSNPISKIEEKDVPDVDAIKSLWKKDGCVLAGNTNKKPFRFYTGRVPFTLGYRQESENARIMPDNAAWSDELGMSIQWWHTEQKGEIRTVPTTYKKIVRKKRTRYVWYIFPINEYYDVIEKYVADKTVFIAEIPARTIEFTRWDRLAWDEGDNYVIQRIYKKQYSTDGMTSESFWENFVEFFDESEQFLKGVPTKSKGHDAIMDILRGGDYTKYTELDF